MLKANKNSEDKLPNPRLEEGCRNEEGRITKQRRLIGFKPYSFEIKQVENQINNNLLHFKFLVYITGQQHNLITTACA